MISDEEWRRRHRWSAVLFWLGVVVLVGTYVYLTYGMASARVERNEALRQLDECRQQLDTMRQNDGGVTE